MSIRAALALALCLTTPSIAQRWEAVGNGGALEPTRGNTNGWKGSGSLWVLAASTFDGATVSLLSCGLISNPLDPTDCYPVSPPCSLTAAGRCLFGSEPGALRLSVTGGGGSVSIYATLMNGPTQAALPADASAGTVPAPGVDTQVLKNDGGFIASDAGIVFPPPQPEDQISIRANRVIFEDLVNGVIRLSSPDNVLFSTSAATALQLGTNNQANFQIASSGAITAFDPVTISDSPTNLLLLTDTDTSRTAAMGHDVGLLTTGFVIDNQVNSGIELVIFNTGLTGLRGGLVVNTAAGGGSSGFTFDVENGPARFSTAGFLIQPTSTPPVTCNISNEGAIYFDSDPPSGLCYCQENPASSFAWVSDGSTVCS